MSTKSLVAVAVLSFCAVSVALADGDRGRGQGRGHGYGHGRPAVVSARVVDVQPLVRRVTVNRPIEQCWDEVVREPVRRYGVAGPTAAGSIVGAAIGRQFGSGNDRDVLTVLGAVATRDVVAQRCEVVDQRAMEEIVDGYLVTYRYDGRHYTMQTNRHPGDWVQVAVDVRPVGYRVRY
jgi:uncharacterized protein YcfJ